LVASARALSAQIDRLLAGESVAQHAGVESIEGLNVARRLAQMVGQLPPPPAQLERRVSALVRAQPMAERQRWQQRRWLPAVWSALATAVVLTVLWLVLPGLGPSGGASVGAQIRAVLLGQTRVEVTPTLTPAAKPVREPLRDLVAAELLIGRAPALPKTLPESYTLQEVAAISYPDLPAWISQPLYVEFCYGEPDTPCALRLRQYRLLFRDFGGISRVIVDSDAVRDVEQVEVNGVTAMRFTLAPERDPALLLQTIVWERDGLLLELESDAVQPEQLLEIARSTR
jgi:hypothetical protein